MLFNADKLKRTLDFYFRSKLHFHSVLRFTAIEWTDSYPRKEIKVRLDYYYVDRDRLNVNDILSVTNGTLIGFTKKTFILKRIPPKYIRKKQ